MGEHGIMSESAHTGDEGEQSARVLVVDDDRTTRHLLQTLLSKHYEVSTATSGEEAIAVQRERCPNLVLMDVEMSGMDGYETCRRIRETMSVPIIFVTNHHSLQEHIKAFDAGGNDIITKPVAGEILLRKVALAIQQHRLAAQLAEEKESLNRMAMGFLSSVGQSGILLNFMRASVACRSHQALAERLVAALGDLGVEGSVLVRHLAGPTALTHHGKPTPLEFAILQQASGMDRVFQFSRRLVVNYDRVSILVANMPDEKTDAEQAGIIRDNVAILAETVEALCDTVDMRIESMRRAEQLQLALAGAVNAVETLRRRYAESLLHTGEQLQELVDEVEKAYSWLETSQAQEQAISGVMQARVRRILAMLNEHSDVDSQFDEVLETLRGGGDQNEIELF